MFSDYSSGRDDEDFLKQYSEVVTKRKNLITDIEELQKNIFNLSLRMCQDEVYGEITIRQKEAYRLFEQGKYKEANDILDFDEIKNEYQRKKAMRKAEQKREARIFIREIKQKIDMLSMLQGLSTKYNNEIEKCYEEIVPEVIEYLENIDCLFEFAEFLYKTGQYDKGLKYAKVLEDIYNNVSISKESEAKLYRLMGLVLKEQDISINNITEEYFQKSIVILEELLTENYNKYILDCTKSYIVLAEFYTDFCIDVKAKKVFEKALVIAKNAVMKGIRQSEDLLLEIYSKYIKICDSDNSLKENLLIEKQRLCDERTRRYLDCEEDLAQSYLDLAHFYSEQGKEDDATLCLQTAFTLMLNKQVINMYEKDNKYN